MIFEVFDPLPLTVCINCSFFTYICIAPECQRLKRHRRPNLVEPQPRYGDFSSFQHGGRRHLGFLKFEIFNGRTAQDGWTTSPCQILSKSVKPRPRYGDFTIFLRWRWSAVLDLCVCSDHPRRAFGGLYRYAKFGWNRCSSFDNMHVFRFHKFGLKKPIHAPKIGVLWDLTH